MSIYKQSKLRKVVAGFVGVVMALSLTGGAGPAHAALTEAQIQSILDLLNSFGTDQATIDNVEASLRGQPVPNPGGGTTGGAGVCPFTWTRTLNVGSTGNDVKMLQMFLNGDSDTRVAATGVGSAGQETEFYGPLTSDAVGRFQAKFAADILNPLGLPVSGVPYPFGPATRSHINSLCTTTTPPPADNGDTTPPPATGTGITVSSGVQPQNILAPQDAARLEFTRVNLTAGTDGAVQVDSMTVELQGNAEDTAFDSVALMNEDGTFIGIPKTLNANDQATVGKAFTVPAGQTKTVIIAGNMDGNLAGESGQTARLAVVAVNTSATVSGTLPIVGATHTINDTLSLGTPAVPVRGAFDPGTGLTLEVGTVDQNFASIKVTAGSAEDVELRSIRWFQSGSVSAEDLENLVTVVDGTEYPTVVDGDFYTTIFPGSGILIKKGFSEDITINGDVVGGSDRTIDFDVDRRDDINLMGKKFDYGLLAPFESAAATADGADFNNANNPYYDAAQHTISSGTIQVSSGDLAAQNIGENVNDQPFGSFTVDVKGEAISVASLAINFGVGSAVANAADLTNVSIVDQNGTVLAGPNDGGTTDTITFTDTVTFPVGITKVEIRGKAGTDFATNDTVAASTTPSTDWTSVTGDTTGKSITPSPTSAVSGATMTVKTGALTVSVSSQPVAQTVIAGADKFEFARYVFDGTQSGEDVRVATIPLYYDTTGTRTDLTNCQLFDGTASNASSLTTGNNVVNPATGDTASSTSFTFDGNGLILPKATAKTLSLRCDVGTDSTGLYWWGLDDGQASSYTGASGVTSGQTVTETLTEANGQVMTAATSGNYFVTEDTSVLYKMAQAGTSNVLLGRFRFEASTTEAVDIKQVALQLGNTASNSPADLMNEKVTLWHGGSQIGEATLGIASSDHATSSLSSAVRVDKGELVNIEVRGDLQVQNAINGTPGAFLAVNYDGDNNGLNGNYATGVDSKSTISGTTEDVSTNGMRIFRSVPTVEDVTTTSSLVDGGDLYKVKVTAGSGRDVLLRAMTFRVSAVGDIDVTTGFTLNGPSGQVNATAAATTSDDGISGGDRLRIAFDDANVDRLISAGTSKTYALQAEGITGLTANNTESLSIALLSDQGAPTTSSSCSSCLVFTVALIEGSASSSDRFVWSPNSTTTPEATAAKNSIADWTNSYGMPGFPGVGQNFSTRVFSD